MCSGRRQRPDETHPAPCRSQLSHRSEKEMKILRLYLALLVPISPARGAPVVPADPPFSADRIERLPPEIRHTVIARCGEHAEAQHYFATYDSNSNVVHLDYSLLQCDRPQRLCGSSGCLHQTFVKSHGRYALKRSSFDAPISSEFDPGYIGSGRQIGGSEASSGIGQMGLGTSLAGHPRRGAH
jgi:hypothetical protein